MSGCHLPLFASYNLTLNQETVENSHISKAKSVLQPHSTRARGLVSFTLFCFLLHVRAMDNGCPTNQQDILDARGRWYAAATSIGVKSPPSGYFLVCLCLNVGRCDHEAHEWATSTHPSIRGSGPFSDSLSDFIDVLIVVPTHSM